MDLAQNKVQGAASASDNFTVSYTFNKHPKPSPNSQFRTGSHAGARMVTEFSDGHVSHSGAGH